MRCKTVCEVNDKEMFSAKEKQIVAISTICLSEAIAETRRNFRRNLPENYKAGEKILLEYKAVLPEPRK